MEAPRILLVDDHSERLRLRRQFFPSHLRTDRVYVRGRAGPEDFRRLSIAIIGTRRPTARGLRWVREIVKLLRTFDCQIISGGALGIDGEAHLAALECGLPTQAWLVGPVARPSPQFHRNIFAAIEASPGGALLVPSQLEPIPGRSLQKGFWIERNQWLAASADALIVVEAQIPSGTWSTVSAALDFGVPVYLVSGPSDSPQSDGVNQMISMGYGTGVKDLAELAESLVVDLGTSFYNESRGQEGS